MKLTLRPIGLFVLIAGVAAIGFDILKPVYSDGLLIAEAPPNYQLVIDSAKELSGIVSMLVTLSTGMFVATALVARQYMRPTRRPSASWVVVFSLFAIFSFLSFFFAVHARYAISEAIFAQRIQFDAIGNLIGIQSWLTTLSGAAVASLIGDVMFNIEETSTL